MKGNKKSGEVFCLCCYRIHSLPYSRSDSRHKHIRKMLCLFQIEIKEGVIDCLPKEQEGKENKKEQKKVGEKEDILLNEEGRGVEGRHIE